MIAEETLGKKVHLEGLNPQQLQAVKEKSGTILVIAGAGSGKTKVLTSRIVDLISEGVNPYEILAVTFTNKAAKEMRERLACYLGEDVVKKMWVGTFHKICGIMLRKDLQNYKTKDGRSWDNKFVIYDDSDSKAVIKAAIKKLNLDEKTYDFKIIKSIISNAKNDMKDAHVFATGARDHKTERISEVYYEYEKQLSINNALDFDDMLLLCASLLEQCQEVRERYSERFKHLLVDEFQDTNSAQYKLIRMLFNDKKAKTAKETGVSLCAVGDVDQSIYSWRGADFKIILNFQKDYPSTELIKLEQNYRSTETILNAANAIILNNTQRLDKNLYSQKGDGEKITLYEALDERSEALYIAGKIKEFSGRYEDIAILYRTNAQSRSIERALYETSLPYKVVGGVKFYDRKEIKDILAYLKVVYNPNDSQSLKRIINTPKRAIGDTTVKKLTELADQNDMSVFEVIKELEENKEFASHFSPRAQTTLTAFGKLVDDFVLKQQGLALSEFASYVLEYSGYLAELRADNNTENEDRIENLQEFINVTREFEYEGVSADDDFGEDLGVLGNFLSQVALVSEADKTEEVQNSITLMSLHASKGLEFPMVFLVGLEENMFPHSRALSYDAKSSDLEEERRLMYVGVTRAKDILYLTYAKQRMVWGDTKCFPISRFIEEIPQELLQNENAQQMHATRVMHNSSNFNLGNQSSSRGSLASSLPRKNTPNYGSGAISAPSNLAGSLKSNKMAHHVVKKNPVKKEFLRPAEKTKAQVKKEGGVKDLIAKCKERAKPLQNAALPMNTQIGLFKVGTRVFHQQFGIGHIKEVQKDVYVIEFVRNGTKSLDIFSSNLKTF